MTKHLSNMDRAEVLLQALPYIQKYVGKVVVIKYGGNAATDEHMREQVMEDIVLLWAIGVKVVLVHGGGPEISKMMEMMRALLLQFSDRQKAIFMVVASAAQNLHFSTSL